jgi:ketosteroid isomerase-like protein
VSQEKVEVVRKSCEAWARGDLAAWLKTLDPDIVWDSSRFEGWFEGSVFRGIDEVRGFLVDEWLASWDRYEARVEEIADAGGRVLVRWWQSMVAAGGGVPLVVHTAQLCSVHDGRVTRIDNYADQSEALKAVGLEE